MTSKSKTLITPVEELSLEDESGWQRGFATMQLDPRNSENGGGGWLLKMIHVHAEARGLGWGSRILDTVIQEFGNEPIRVRVESFDHSPIGIEETRNWYSRHGFSKSWDENNKTELYMMRPGNEYPNLQRQKPLQDYTEAEIIADFPRWVHRIQHAEGQQSEIRRHNRYAHWAIRAHYSKAIPHGAAISDVGMVEEMANRIKELESLIDPDSLSRGTRYPQT
jgi:hypothetical protein